MTFSISMKLFDACTARVGEPTMVERDTEARVREMTSGAPILVRGVVTDDSGVVPSLFFWRRI